MRYKFICLVTVAMCTVVFGLNVDARAADSTSLTRMIPDLPPVLPPNNASRDLVFYRESTSLWKPHHFQLMKKKKWFKFTLYNWGRFLGPVATRQNVF
jgi:hypothetical protein